MPAIMYTRFSQPGFPRNAWHLCPSVLVILLVSSAMSRADETYVPEGVQVGVHAEPQTATVGDPIRVQVEVTHPPGVRVEIPQPAAQVGDFTVISFSRGTPRRVDRTSNVVETATLIVAAYKTGDLTIPGIPFKVSTAGGSGRSLMTAPSQIKIQSVLSGKNPELKDLKKQAEIEEPFPFLRWAAVLAAVAALTLLAWRLLRRRRRTQITAATQPTLDPLQLAEAELRDLISRALPEKGFVKQFYVALSDVARKMLEGGYEIPTAEKTTTEIIEALRGTTQPAPEPARLARIEALLEACDLVKFAKYIPGRDEIDGATRATFELLDHCRQHRAAVSAGVGPAVGAA